MPAAASAKALLRMRFFMVRLLSDEVVRRVHV
jgi:hypothetical protein